MNGGVAEPRDLVTQHSGETTPQPSVTGLRKMGVVICQHTRGPH